MRQNRSRKSEHLLVTGTFSFLIEAVVKGYKIMMLSRFFIARCGSLDFTRYFSQKSGMMKGAASGTVQLGYPRNCDVLLKLT